MSFFKNAALLLAGGMMYANTSNAQSPVAHSKVDIDNKTEQVLNFTQNKDATLKINPDFKVPIKYRVPINDTTRKFYPSARTTKTVYSTPMEEKDNINNTNQSIVDKTILVRETLDGKYRPRTADELAESADKIIAMHVQQSYSKDKSGHYGDLNGGLVEKDKNYIKMYINEREAVKVVTIDDVGIIEETYDFSNNLSAHGQFLNSIASGEEHPEDSFKDTGYNKLPTINKTNGNWDNNSERMESSSGPLLGMKSGKSHAVVEFQNDTGYKLKQILAFK